jgi:hypothetical protein
MISKSSRYALATLCAFALPAAQAETVFALGPVDTSQAPATVSILGQTFQITSRTTCAVRGAVTELASCLPALQADAYVAVEADRRDPSKAAAILILGDRYVPGASAVKLIGRVTGVNDSLGTAAIGSLSVDQNAVPIGTASNAKVGSLVEYVGTQPVLGGLVLASSRRAIKVPTTQIIVGTGKASLADTNIIVGTGKAATSNPSTNIIVGTGKSAAASTDIIVGTGRSVAPSTNIIVGTGKSAAASTNIIVGTGRASVSSEAIVGSGASSPSTNIIVGTGKSASASTNIIVGTGKAAVSSTDIIVGTGRSAAASTNIIVGTGRQ